MSKVIFILLLALNTYAAPSKVLEHDEHGHLISGSLEYLKQSIYSAKSVSVVLVTKTSVQSFKFNRAFVFFNNIACGEAPLYALNHSYNTVPYFNYQINSAYALFCTDGKEYVKTAGGSSVANRFHMSWFVE